MKIGIDARMFGPTVGGGGLGRYVEQLVTELQANDTENRYVLFLKKENFDACRIVNPHFEKRLADIHWYTLGEQMKFGGIVDREQLDLVHFPHWNVPVLMKTPFVVTIHDLILLEEPRSSKVTTRNPFIFFLKYVGYKIVLSHAIRRSKKIVAVSHATEDAIIKFFPDVPRNKIEMIYEGVTRLETPPGLPFAGEESGIYFSPPAKEGPGEDAARNLLYVGNAYPHKNLERLLEAFAIIRKTHPNAQLILAGGESIFYKRLLQSRAGSGVTGSRDPAYYEGITFVPNPTDEQLAGLYREATLFVFPSRVEGFGLPPLEAMSVGVAVAASDIPSLKEILGNAAAFFDPNDSQRIASVVSDLLVSSEKRAVLIERGTQHIKQFSWKTMAIKIIALYETCGKKSA